MELEEAIRIMDLFVKNIAVENVKVFELKDACKVALKQLEHLQKENEELKNMDLTIVHLKGVADEKDRWRNKINKKIEFIKCLKEKIYYEENVISILECLID